MDATRAIRLQRTADAGRIESEFTRIAKRVGREGCSLPKLNVTSDKPQVELSSAARDVIACLYQADLKLWQSCDH